MAIPDQGFAHRHLAHINYYRLRAYWLPFECESDDGTDDHRFAPGTSFKHALDLYNFDRHLRLLLLDAIERVEVSLRTQWATILSLQYGAHAYLKPDIFYDHHKYQDCLDGLKKEMERSQETFIKHYRECYTIPSLPPIWAACEVMTLGQLSKWFQNLKYRQDRLEIAKVYQLDEKVLRSFVHHLAHVRNLCAHHSRIWNRLFTVTMQIPRQPLLKNLGFNPDADRRIYNTLVMLGHILKTMIPDSTWVTRIKQLIADFPQINLVSMGFPKAWEDLPVWAK